jgi:hypothetical protein
LQAQPRLQQTFNFSQIQRFLALTLRMHYMKYFALLAIYSLSKTVAKHLVKLHRYPHFLCGKMIFAFSCQIGMKKTLL